MTPGPASFELRRVEHGRDLRRFIRFPGQLYAGDPHWVHPLEFEFRQRLAAGHPLFRHLRWRAWLAVSGDEVLGRISAQVDDLQQQTHGDATGSFGLFEARDRGDVAAALVDTAAAWLRGEGMRRVRGPLNLSINQECGLLVDGFDTPPSMMMGHARPYYDRLLCECGFERARDLLAYRIAPDFTAPAIMTRLIERARDRVQVRPFRRADRDAEFERLRGVFNDAWSGNWGFVPFTRDEFAEIGRSVTALVRDDFIQIAEHEGEPVAFIIAMPNINEILARMNGRLLPFGWLRLLWGLKVRYPRSARVPLMGVRRHWQHTRLGPGLAFLVIDAVRQAMIERGIREVELSWILEDNAGMRNIIESIGGEAYKTYRLYERDIVDA
jgi:hypothetical protein